MTCLTLICLVITSFLAFSTKGEFNIFVGKESEKQNCDNCLKFTKLLEGLEASFLSSFSGSLTLLDEDYHLKEGNFTEFLQNNKTSYFFSSIWQNQIRNFTISGANSGSPSKIIFYDEIFTINWRNLNLKLENINIIFLHDVKTTAKCFLCLNTKENDMT